MTHSIRTCGWLASCLLPVLIASVGQSQELNPRYSELPADSIALISVDVASIKSQPELELIPWEIISTGSKEELGFDASTD